jgi:hypothetical protein
MHRHFIIVGLLLSLANLRADDFILSYWCGPTEDQDLDARHAEIAECGFTYAMPPCGNISPANAKKSLEACKKYGLKYMLNDGRLMQFEPSHPAFKTNLDAMITEYAGYEALGGYHITDEPGPELFPKLAGINQYLLEKDPKHLPYINLYPNYVPEWAIGGTYEQYIEKFLTMVKPRLLCYDHYALLNNNIERPIYFENLEIIRRQGLKHNVPIGFIFQLIAHFDYREVNESELRWQANTGLIYGTRALLYFTYWSPSNVPDFKGRVGIINDKGERSRHYAAVKQVNSEIRAWAPTLMKLKSTEVYTGALPGATRPLPTNSVVQFKDEGAFVVGTFQHDDKSEWLMIMNRDMHKPVSTTLRFDKSVKRMSELSNRTGKLSSTKLRKNELPVELPAGGAKLFKISPKALKKGSEGRGQRLI